MAEVVLPDFQDEVTHKTGEASGVVITTYEKNGIRYLDVFADNRVIYDTPASNWETTVKYVE